MIIPFFLCFCSLTLVEPLVSFPSDDDSTCFILSLEEMVFASKLTDRYRRSFCYEFCKEQREKSMQLVSSFTENEEHKKLSPDDAVAYVQGHFDSFEVGIE